jgi:glycosyltransferase involved in cell wall biosynthesis
MSARTLIVGVDPDEFRRSSPHAGGRVVVAVARLVEKKGLAVLIDAAARVSPERLVIVGDGPLRAELEAQASAVGLDGVAEFPGEQSPAQIRALLEGADLLAAPCVVAANGDRDTMPVVVKEALAMEVPVVASDEVGLPEVVRPEWGRLVPPGDADALAAAIDELLALPASERAAMGRAGREFVAARCNVFGETAKLAGWIAEAVES